MNNKLGYIFVLLVLGTFVFSGCNIIEQDAVGRKITKEKNIAGDSSKLTGYGDDRRVAEVLVPAQPANVTYNLTVSFNPSHPFINNLYVWDSDYYNNYYPPITSRIISTDGSHRLVLFAPYNANFTNWSGDIPPDINRTSRAIELLINRNIHIVANFIR